MTRFTIILSLVLTSFASYGQNYLNTNGIAAGGYDVVAYFKQHEAIKGNSQFTFSWQNVNWQFSNVANLEAFRKNPQQFAPQFGGYCAYGVSENHKSPTNPNAFTIIDSKLYLNYSPAVKEKWLKDTKGRIVKAEQNWPGLQSKD